MGIPWKLIFLADDLSASSAIFNHAIFSSISSAIAAETVQGAAAGEATGRTDSASAYCTRGMCACVCPCLCVCVPACVCECALALMLYPAVRVCACVSLLSFIHAAV